MTETRQIKPRTRSRWRRGHRTTSDEEQTSGAERERGGVLHQRRRLPMSPMTMAVGGFVIVATIGYFTLYAKAKPDATPSEVAKIASGGHPNPK
ncbi:hypothetical protein QJS10_CPB19g00709 [Acorus calamus]|uniref:Transmembrane protein n=1 Tax=Acorus calamus TaxID=4465 RepID=A0AAV9CHC7_ACOCL|nr:hypothetical protein QJS10_CPB19g00709 [Acorus calamus]